MNQPTSFLSIHKISEYFQGTIIRYNGELKYLKNVEFVNDEDGVFTCRLFFRDSPMSPTVKVDIKGRNYDELVSKFEPFLPPTKYYLDREGKAWLCGYDPSTSYKKSFCRPRYSAVRCRYLNIRDVSHSPLDYGDVVPTTIPALLSDPEESGLRPLDDTFALYIGPLSEVPVVLYLQYPVAKLDDFGRIVPHPKYYEFFVDRLSKFGEVVNAG